MTEAQDVSVSRLRRILTDPAAARAAVIEEARSCDVERIEARLEDIERRVAALEARMATEEKE